VLSSLTHARGRIAAIGAVIAVLLIAGVWVAFTHASDQPSASAATGGSKQAGKTAKQTQATPLRLVSETPSDGATSVDGSTDIQIQFSAPVAANSPLPSVRPDVAGTWQGVGTSTLKFVPAGGFDQLTRVTVRVPGGTSGVRSATGGLLVKSARFRFRTTTYSTTRLEQLLAQLDYLPLNWSAAAGAATPAAADRAAQVAAAYSPPQGTFTWQAGWPHRLKTFWQNGASTSLILKGAVMLFENDHGLAMDGIPGPQVWSALFKAVATNQVSTHGYSYALASEGSPETLTVWHNGKVILHTLANTGIQAAPTTLGTAPVYLRYYYQIMKGQNPDGSHYADPVYYVSYFRSGEAVHYFNRGSYGFPQSLGCVELPFAQAKFVWPYMNYGTLVTVARGADTPAGSPTA
jgi:L,D-transpeptidase catalytic domain/Bacterial Ig-like domain